MNSKRFWQYFDKLLNFFALVAGILLLLVILFVSYAVVVRYLHFKPPIWVLQYTEYALLWITFLGAAWLLREGGHIRIDTVVVRLDPKTRIFLNVLVSFLCCVVCIVVIWFGTQKTMIFCERGVMDVKGVTVPKFAPFIIIPIGGLMLFVQFCRIFFKHVKTLFSGEEV